MHAVTVRLIIGARSSTALGSDGSRRLQAASVT